MKQLYAFLKIILAFLLINIVAFGVKAQDGKILLEYYDSLANSFFKAGEIDSSIYYFKRLKHEATVRDSLGKDISATNWIASLYYATNKPDSIDFYLNTVAKEIDSLTAGTGYHEGAMVWWNIKSALFSLYGENLREIECTGNSLKILERQQPPDIKNLIVQYQNTGQEYGDLGDYGNAIKYSEYGLLLAQNNATLVGDKVWISILNTLGWLYKQTADNQKSSYYYQKALSFFDNDSSLKKSAVDLYVKILWNNGLFEYLNKDYLKADQLLTKALSIAEQNKTALSTELPNVLQCLGLAKFELDDKENAKLYLEESLHLTKQALGSKNKYTAFRYLALGGIYPDQPNIALAWYQKALVAIVHEFNDSTGISNPDLSQTISSKIDLLDILKAKAKALQQLKNFPTALKTYQLAVDLIDNLRINYTAEASKHFLQENALPIYEGAIQTALTLDEKELAFYFAEKSKAVLVLENIKNLQAQSFANIPADLLLKERAFKVEMAFAERQLFEVKQSGKKADKEKLQKKLFELKRSYGKFLEELEAQFPKYFRLKYDTGIVGVDKIQSDLLDEKMALIEYFVGDSTVVLFLVTKEFHKVFSLPKAKDFEQKIERFKTIISKASTSQKDFESFTGTAFYFYEKLLKPYLLELNVGVNKLLIIPDAQLNYIPFQTLIRHEVVGVVKQARYDTLHYLVKDFAITYAFSTTLYWEMTRTVSKPETALQGFAGFAPLFLEKTTVKNGGINLSPLPNSKNEMLQINKILDGNIFLEKAASKNNFITNVGQYKILHLATHAIPNDSFPANSAIYFHDDKLTAGEIYNLPLHANLAVLSACETGTGQLQRGEGLMSLARAFTYAGCPALLTSLWKVDDFQSATIMLNFYENLSRNRKKDFSMQQAQLSYLADEQQSYEQKHPYYWAAFVLAGNPVAILENDFSFWYYLLGSVFAIVLLYLSAKRFL